jgi:hypothetical protein
MADPEHRLTPAVEEPENPPLPPRHLPRPRLTRLLENPDVRAAVLIAPAGFGKTTLAAEFVREREHLWYAASAADFDLETLATELFSALGRRGSPIASGLPRHLSPTTLAELFVEALGDARESLWVVVDDYHHTMSSDVEDFWEHVLVAGVPRLLVTSRVRPSWLSTRRLLSGRLLEIGAAELSFNRLEAIQVLAGHRDRWVREFVGRAQGWPALVGIAALSRRPNLPQTDVPDKMFHYFADEVLAQRPDAVQRVMLEAAVLPAIDQVAGRPTGRLSPAGAKEQWFIHSPVLPDFASLAGDEICASCVELLRLRGICFRSSGFTPPAKADGSRHALPKTDCSSLMRRPSEALDFRAVTRSQSSSTIDMTSRTTAGQRVASTSRHATQPPQPKRHTRSVSASRRTERSSRTVRRASRFTAIRV